MGALIRYGRKGQRTGLGSFVLSEIFSPALDDMQTLIQFLDQEGIPCQILYPSLGLLADGFVKDPELAAAHRRAYNTWTLEVCTECLHRSYPISLISFRNASAAVQESERLATAEVRAMFVGARPVHGKRVGHPDIDPVLAAAQELKAVVGLQLVVHPFYPGNEWHKDPNPDFMFVSLNAIQDPHCTFHHGV